MLFREGIRKDVTSLKLIFFFKGLVASQLKSNEESSQKEEIAYTGKERQAKEKQNLVGWGLGR